MSAGRAPPRPIATSAWLSMPAPARSTTSRGARLRARRHAETADAGGHEPRRVTLEEDGELAVGGDDGLPSSARGGADDDPGGAGGRHAQGTGGITRARMAQTTVVHLVDLRGHEARIDEDDRDAVTGQLAVQGLGERAQGEL